MASVSSHHISTTVPCPFASRNYTQIYTNNSSSIKFPERKKGWGVRSNQNSVGTVMCESKESSAETGLKPEISNSLQIGSPIIIVEAPKTLKTAASVPCLRVNSGIVKAGDVGRERERERSTELIESAILTSEMVN